MTWLRKQPSNTRWSAAFLVICAAIAILLMLRSAWGQGDPTPIFQHLPVQIVDTTGQNRVNVGDLSNQAVRVNVVTGGGTGGTSSAFAVSFPGTGTAAGFRDPSGFLASASVTNNNALYVESVFRSTTDAAVRAGDVANNAVRVNVVAGSSSGPSGTTGAAWPSSVNPMGAKDPGGFVGSLTITNGGLLNVFCTGCGGPAATGIIANAYPTLAAPIGLRDPSGFVASASATNNNALFVETIFPTTTNVGVRAGDSSNNALRVNIVTGTVAITAPSSFGAGFPTNGIAVGFSDGTNMIAARARTNTPGSSDPGIVTRPLMPTDGTNTMPTGDSTSRPIYVAVTNGSTVTQDNNSLELGATTVAQTNSLNYGSVIRNPSTMTLGNNATGMRATYGRAGQQIVQMNAPVGDTITGFASMTTTANTEVVAAQLSGIRYCMTDYMIGNLSATDTYVVFRSGQTDITGYIPVPGNTGGNNKSLVTPICTASASALNIKAHIAVATVTVTVNGYKSKDF